ncbi:unnamed protein product [Fraxinus pennsylvanica]|uniref:Uncharacterized protein n=1 Tax=Fraxinus pennsylvanica TaxID=56036 RepID=A0AAD2EEF0_9LAMI|nr:unnamed protein product [Fraxinus pennsylvanica]
MEVVEHVEGSGGKEKNSNAKDSGLEASEEEAMAAAEASSAEVVDGTLRMVGKGVEGDDWGWGLGFKSRRKLTVFFKKGGSFLPFRLRKTVDASEESQEGNSGNSNPSRFDFGNLPNMKSLVLTVINMSSGLN